MMTNLITLIIPNDDYTALRAFGKALEEMALAHGAEPHKSSIDTTEAPERPNDITITVDTVVGEFDTTPQQFDSLSASMSYDESPEEFLQRYESSEPVYDEESNNEIDSHVHQDAPGTDSTNTPWDERIHAATKALNADGTWRLRRKPKDMDEAEWLDYVSTIKANPEYAAKSGEEKPVNTDHESVDHVHDEDNEIAESTIEPPVTPPGDDFYTDTGVVTEQTVAGIPPLPVPPPVLTPVVTDWTFPKVMEFLTQRHGKIDIATVNSLLAADGMSTLQELNANPDRIDSFVARVKAYLGE